MIEGVVIKELKVIPDERGRLMEILRCDDPFFRGFGQVYITTAYPGVIKAWHYHKKQYDNFTVLTGMMKVALFDDREGSPTRGKLDEYYLGGCIIQSCSRFRPGFTMALSVLVNRKHWS